MGLATFAIMLGAAILIIGAAFGVYFYVDFFISACFPKFSLGGRPDPVKPAMDGAEPMPRKSDIQS